MEECKKALPDPMAAISMNSLRVNCFLLLSMDLSGILITWVLKGYEIMLSLRADVSISIDDRFLAYVSQRTQDDKKLVFYRQPVFSIVLKNLGTFNWLSLDFLADFD